MSVTAMAVSIHVMGIKTRDNFLKSVSLDSITRNTFVETILQNYDVPFENRVEQGKTMRR
jgi:hypothetical protein